MTDYWGPVLYSSFGNQELSVPLILSNLCMLISLRNLMLQVQLQLEDGSAFGGSDLVYGGDASKWRKLAESMRLRLAMRMGYTDPATSKAQAEKAYNSGALITSNDNAFIATSECRNPLETITDGVNSE